ncbi:TPA: hypothetical protein U3P15_001000 [Streptococcus agalactiae]|nr:hypothetical protein [Streptococcus agalactiae]
MEFNAESTTVFGGLTEVQDAVSAGLNYVSEGFRNFNGTFDTSGKGLDWTKTIKTGREVRKEARDKELKKKKSNESYDGKDAINDLEGKVKDVKNYATEIAGQQFSKIS